ncbi:Glutamate receptor ionotropic, delta-1 [Nymphon striatum]|nr:Glutamate receptor ionotropic, delta-1 [Nymphon striatum]
MIDMSIMTKVIVACPLHVMKQSKKLFQTNSVFCILSRGEEDVNIVEENLKVTGIEKIFILHESQFIRDIYHRQIALREFFHNYNFGRTRSRFSGYWDKRKGLKLFRSIEESCNDITGAKIRVVTVEHEPFVKIEERKPKLVISGFFKDLLTAMEEAAGIEFSLYEAPDGKFGRLGGNGTWDGMVGEVVNKRADAAFAAFTPSAQRMMAVDFAPLFFEEYLAVFYKHYARQHLRTRHDSKVQKHTFGGSSWLNVVGGKHTCYTSVLVSYLAVNNAVLPFKNVDELIMNNEYGIVFVNGTIEPAIAKGSSSLSADVWDPILKNSKNFANSHKEGVERALEGAIGFVSFSSLIITTKNVETNILIDKGIKSADALVFPKNSPFLSSINRLIMEMKEVGVLQRIVHEYLEKENKHSESSGVFAHLDRHLEPFLRGAGQEAVFPIGSTEAER